MTDPQDQTLQILGLRYGEQDRVVRALGQLVEEVEVRVPVRGYPEDVPEPLPPHVMRAGEGEEMAVVGKPAQRLLVQIDVALLSLFNLFFRFDEARWIKDRKVVCPV